MASPAWAVSQCDGGHGSEAGCERFLRPYVAERLYLFGARPQGIPESFSLSWPECGRTIPVQAVQFWSLGDNSSTTSKRWGVGKSLSAKRQRTSSTIVGPPFAWVSALQELFPDGSASKESRVLKPFRRSAPNVESDAASALVCWTSDIRTDANPRPA